MYLKSQFATETCVACGTVWAMLVSQVDKRQRDHKSFYCPNGHAQFYPRKSDVEILREKVAHCQSDIKTWKEGYEAKNNRLQTVERSRRAYKGQVTKLKKVLSGGNGHEVENEGD